MQNDLLKQEVQEMKQKYSFDITNIDKGNKSRLAMLYGISEKK